MFLNEIKTSLFFLNSIKNLKKNQTSLISIFTKCHNEINKNPNIINQDSKNNETVEDDWFEKLTEKHSSKKKDVSRKVNFENLNDEEKRRLIIDVWESEKHKGRKPMPKYLDESNFNLLIKNSNSLCDITSGLIYIVKQNYYKEQNERRKEMIRKRKEEKLLEGDNVECITNYWGHKTFLRRLGRTYEQNFYRNKILSSITNDEPSVVFDFRFEPRMKHDASRKSLYRQIGYVMNINKKSTNPFKLHFCNLNRESLFLKEFGEILAFDTNLIFETEKSYLDLFPRKKLVYLSRDANKTMKYFDPEKVYIIGAMIDKGPTDFLYASYGQAKQENIECERLPLEQYVQFAGGKNLNIDHMMRILTELYKSHSDWDLAFRNALPVRKVHSFYSKDNKETEF